MNKTDCFNGSGRPRWSKQRRTEAARRHDCWQELCALIALNNLPWKGIDRASGEYADEERRCTLVSAFHIAANAGLPARLPPARLPPASLSILVAANCNNGRRRVPLAIAMITTILANFFTFQIHLAVRALSLARSYIILTILSNHFSSNRTACEFFDVEALGRSCLKRDLKIGNNYGYQRLVSWQAGL